MSAYVLIIALAMPSYDGGVAVQWIPFATKEACNAAAGAWNKTEVVERRGYIRASCHATGATNERH